MSAGRATVGVLGFIQGLAYLAIAYYWAEFVGFVAELPLVGDMLGGWLSIILWILIILGIFWIILAIGLFADQEWAATLTMVLAIISLIVSLLHCNCIGIILAIIIIWLVKD